MEKFEQDIEKRLSDFSIEPSAQVWKDVEAALHEKRKRRFAAWWWMPIAGMLILGFGWWFFIQEKNGNNTIAETVIANKNNNLTTQKNDDNTVIIEANKLKNNITSKEEVEKTVSLKSNEIVVDDRNNNHQFNKNKSNVLGKRNGDGNTNTELKKSKIKVSNETRIDAKEASVFVDTKKDNVSIEKEKANTITAIEKQKDSVLIKDTASLIAKENKQTTLPKDTTATTKKVTKIIEKSKKHQWYLVAGGGASLVKGNTFLSSNTQLDAYTSTSIINTPSTGGLANNQPNNKLPNTGMFILLGINYERNLSKHWAATTGLQYRYIQNKQLLKNDTSIRNYAHWLQVPLNIQYTINPQAKSKLQLQLGGSMAWALSQKWLVAPKTGNYYYNKALNNNFIFNVHAGASIQAKNGHKFSLMAEQSLTPIHKQNNYKYYWQQYSFQVNMPLNLLHKTKK